MEFVIAFIVFAVSLLITTQASYIRPPKLQAAVLLIFGIPVFLGAMVVLITIFSLVAFFAIWKFT